MKQTDRSVFSGVLTLSAAGIFVKVLGLVYKVPLTYLLGDSGMGYFNCAYTVYTFFYVLTTSGLPVALSMMVSAELGKGSGRDAVLRNVAYKVFGTVGAVGSFMLYVFALPISRAVGNVGAVYTLKAIAPALFFSCISAAGRGYFQGHQFMLPSALSQLVEAVCKLVLGISLAMYAAHKGADVEIIAAYAVFGITIGSFLSAIVPLLFKTNAEKIKESHTFSLVKKLLSIAFPITLCSGVISLSSVLDLATIMNRLQNAGYSEGAANAMYGNYSSVAVALVNMPIVLIVPISTGIVPYVSRRLASGDKTGAHLALEGTLRMTLIIATPAAIGLAALPTAIADLIFESQSAKLAGGLLAWLAVSLVFTAISNVTSSFLQASGHCYVPVWSMLTGGAVKVALSWVMVSKIGMYAAPVSTIACYLVISTINLAALSYITDNTISVFKMLVKPLFCAFVSCGAAVAIYHITDITLVAVAFAVVLYLIFILLTGAVRRSDAENIPLVAKVLRFIESLHLFPLRKS